MGDLFFVFLFCFVFFAIFFFRIKQLFRSLTQLTFGSVAEIFCMVTELATIPMLDEVLKTQELAPGPGGPWVPLYPDGPRRPCTPASPDGPAGPRVPLYPGGPAGPAGPISPLVPLYPGGPGTPVGPTSPLLPLTAAGPMMLLLLFVFFT